MFDVDGDRPGGFVFGGDHWGSSEAPCNVYTGAFAGRARRITFRASALHSSDLDAFGVGNVLVLDDLGGIECKRTLFYDRRTGVLLHSHYEVHAVEPRDGSEPGCRHRPPSNSTTTWPSSCRTGLDPGRLGSVTTSVAPQSSRRTTRFVDVKTGRLRSRRLARIDVIASQEDH